MSIGVYDRTGAGLITTCKICSTEFRIGGTYVYCPRCSFAIQSKNYSSLTSTEKSILWRYNYQHGGKTYMSRPGYAVGIVRRWRKKYPQKKYTQKQRGVDRYTNETLMYADNHRQRWDFHEVEHLRRFGHKRTARELAVDLGRTYSAIIGRACIERIPLMTEDKKRGRRITCHI